MGSDPKRMNERMNVCRKTLQGKKEVMRNQTARTKQSGCL